MMARFLIQCLFLLVLVACTTTGPWRDPDTGFCPPERIGANSDAPYIPPGYREDRVLPLFDGYWAYATDVGMPGLDIGFPDPDIRHVYIEQGKVHNVVGFDDYQLIANDLKTLTSYILVRSKMFFPKGQKYTYSFEALQYAPPPQSGGGDAIVMFVKYGGFCNHIEANQDLWDHFDPQIFMPLIAPGGPCHYESDDTMWDGRLTYGRHW